MKLSDIDSEDLARRTVDQILGEIGMRLIQLGPAFSGEEIQKPEDTDWAVSTDLGVTIVALTRYAQTGTGLDTPAEEYTADLGLLDIVDRVPGLRTVINAAEGRQRLDEGQTLTGDHLAALAGLSPRSLASLASRGDVPPPEHPGRRGGKASEWEAETGRQWLAARGVTVTVEPVPNVGRSADPKKAGESARRKAADPKSSWTVSIHGKKHSTELIPRE